MYMRFITVTTVFFSSVSLIQSGDQQKKVERGPLWLAVSGMERERNANRGPLWLALHEVENEISDQPTQINSDAKPNNQPTAKPYLPHVDF
jgi:hypothetical protein